MKPIAALMLAAAIVAFALLPLSASAEPARSGEIRILGHATIEVVPDEVITRIGVTTQAKTPKSALDQNSAAAAKIIAFAKSFGIDPKDIRTDSVRLSPIYRTERDKNGGGHQVLEGYRASNQVRVRLRELARLGEFMRQVLDHGATNIAGLQFALSEPDKAHDEALAKAVDDAMHKAQLLAQAAKIKLGHIKKIVEPPRVESDRGPLRMASYDGAPKAVPIEAGTIAISAAVDIVWSLE